jgi:hypothetical protein
MAAAITGSPFLEGGNSVASDHVERRLGGRAIIPQPNLNEFDVWER